MSQSSRKPIIAISKPRLITLSLLLYLAFAPLSSLSLDIVSVSAGDSHTEQGASLKYALLKAILENTLDDFGPYSLNTIDIHMNGHRGMHELQTGDIINVYFAFTRSSFEKKAIGIPIPVRRGLASYRVLLINQDEQDRFKYIKTVDELKALTTGADPTWATYAVLEHHEFNIINVRNYTSLFEMLARKRFNYLIRAVNEVKAEAEHYGKAPYNLMIEPNILLYLPSANYIFVSKHYPRIAKRIETGLQRLVESGDYESLFDHHFASYIDEIDFKSRRLIEISNPFLPSSVPVNDPKLWLNAHPKTVK